MGDKNKTIKVLSAAVFGGVVAGGLAHANPISRSVRSYSGSRNKGQWIKSTQSTDNEQIISSGFGALSAEPKANMGDPEVAQQSVESFLERLKKNKENYQSRLIKSIESVSHNEIGTSSYFIIGKIKSNGVCYSTGVSSFCTNDPDQQCNSDADCGGGGDTTAPTVNTNTGLTLDEGATATITTSQLSASDDQDSGSNISFIVGSSAPSNGALKNNGTTLTSGGTFTQQDLVNNNITYVHDGSDTTSDSFTFTVKDSTNNATSSATFNITVNAVDDAKPTVTTFSASDTQLKAGETATITIELSEASSDFNIGDISVTGGELSNFVSTSATQYSVLFTPTADSEATATLDINAGSFTDAAGNGNTAATQLALTVDTQAPTGHSVALNDTSYNSSEASSASFSFTGGEVGASYSYTISSANGGADVTGNGTLTSATQSIGNINLGNLNDGTLTLSVTVTDSAGNAAGAVTDTATLDKTKPTVTTFSASDTQLKAGETATISIVLSEASSDFNIGDISVTGGSLTNFVSISATQYSVLFTPTVGSETNATLDINADSFTDAAGNGNTAATQLLLTVDTQAPSGHSVAFGDTRYSDSEKGSASFSFTGAEVGASYSYTISSANGGSDVTGNGTLTSATQSIGNINLGGLNDGDLTLSVTLTDTSGNAATAVTATSALDTAVPSGHSVALNDTSYNSSEASSASFSFTGGEVGASYSYTISSANGGADVTGNGTLTSATQSIGNINLGNLNDGTLTLSVTVTDSAGNVATAVTDTATLDKTRPTVTTFSASDTQLKAGETATISIVLSEASSDFNIGDISVTGGELSNFVSTSATQYSAIFTPTANSEANATLDINADSFTDAAGNGNTAATQLSLTVDTQAPSG
ncbi:Ig-like domain-containing protein, partial [Photobacterium alginatilyticum]